MTNMKLNPQTLVDAVHGDLQAFSLVQKQPHERIQQARASLSELIITPANLCIVLNALLENEASPEQVHLWAFFIRHGYVGYWEEQPINDQDQLEAKLQGHTLLARHQTVPSGPIKPIDIEYDVTSEDKIADVMARLDDIGTSFDGEVTKDEIAKMLRDLADDPYEQRN